MSDKTKQYIGYAIVLIAVIVAGVLGYSYPLPAPPDDSILLRLNSLEQAAQFTSFTASGSGEGYTNFTSLNLSEDLYVGDDATIVGDLDAATITTGNLVSQSVGFNATSNTTLVTTTVTGPLTVSGAGVISGTSTLVGDVAASDDVAITDQLTVGGAVTITGNTKITGTTALIGDVTASDDVAVTDQLTAGGAVTVTGNFKVGGTTDLVGNVSSSTGALTITDSVNATGAVDFDSTLNVDGASTLVGNVTLSALLKPGFADETITDGETLTPTKTVYALDSAGGVTMTLAASASEGQLLFLVGDDANTITIADTNIRSSDGNAITLGQYDAAAFVYQDSEWIELLKIANQ